jgi:hypothetical protein
MYQGLVLLIKCGDARGAGEVQAERKQNGVAMVGHPVERCSLTEALAHDV